MTHPEPIQQFEQRKQDHIRLALDPKNQALGLSGLDQVRLVHEALPELDFQDIDITTDCLGHSIKAPFLVSSMTAGHHDAIDINRRLAQGCEAHNWPMGVGSQRRQLTDKSADQEWQGIRRDYPKVHFLGNIGLAQLIHTPTKDIQRLVDSLEAVAMIVHCNALQECLQPEGTPTFKGGLQAIEQLCRHLNVPIVIKETGCGFSRNSLIKLKNIGIAAVELSGLGGTHWGRIEGERALGNDVLANAAQSYKNWGVSTVSALLNGIDIEPDYALWASGGVRSGLDGAKLIAMGASMVGIAKPALEAALKGPEALDTLMTTYEYELKMALFCTGQQNLHAIEETQPWTHQGI